MMLSEYIEIHKNTIVTSICGVIVAICFTVIYVYTRTPSYPDVLVAADSLFDSSPQKAEAALKSYRVAHKDMDGDTEWYCRFLQLKSDVKQLKGAELEKEAAAIVDHYESEADSRMLPQVYYYAGSAYYLMGDAMQAMKYFYKGLPMVPETGENENLRASYYYMLGGILTYQHLDKEALAVQMKALEIFEKHRNYRRMLHCSLSVSWSLKSLERHAESLAYLKKAKYYAERYGMEEYLGAINSQMADRYYVLGKYGLAEKYVIVALKDESRENRSAAYNTALNIYEAVGDREKAKHYSDELLECGTVYSKQAAYRFLARYFRQNGDMEKAYRNSLEYSAVTDTIVQLTASEYSAKANAMFNYKFIEKERDRLKLKLKEKDVVLYIAAVIVLIAFVYVLVFWYRNLKRRRMLAALLADARSRNEEVMMQHKRELADIRRSMAAMASERRDIQERFRQKEMEIELLLQKNEMRNRISVSAENLFRETPVYKALEEACRNPEKLSVNTVDWSMLESTLFEVFPTFRDGILKFKRMGEQAYRVCLLLKAGFNVQEIAFLTIRSDEAINSTRRRLYEANFGKKGKPSDWDKVIRAL